MTGEESLGNGWKVGFTLESDFASDDGTMTEGGQLFDSQAYLKITNDVFTVAAGNIGGLGSAGGDFDMVGGFDPMEAAFGVGGMGVFGSRDLTFTNSVVFQLAPVDGLTFSAMASFGSGDSVDADTTATPSQPAVSGGDGEAKWKDRDHYYAFGAQYDANDLSLAAVVEGITYSNKVNATKNASNTVIYTLGAAYDFGVVRPSVMYQHGNKIRSFQGEYDLDEAFNYDAFLVGASAPLGNGTLKAAVQYLNGKFKGEQEDTKANAWVLGAAYVYDLSKRTSLYAGATYAWGSKGFDNKGNSYNEDFTEPESGVNGLRTTLNGYQFGLGLNHTF